MGYQVVVICGRLGKDPEMKYTANGKAVTTFSVAVGKKVIDREETEWFNVVLWEKQAETAAQYLTKGREVLIQGEMKTRSWDGADGVKHYRTELIGRSMQFVGGNGNHAGAANDDEVPFEN